MLDIIICANFGLEKLRGLGNTRGQILEFPIEMAGHPYNSAALPRILWLKSNLHWLKRKWSIYYRQLIVMCMLNHCLEWNKYKC